MAISRAVTACPPNSQVIVCHGSPRCDYDGTTDFIPCHWCFSFHPDEVESVDAIIEEMNKCH